MRCRNTEIHWSRHVTEEMFRTALFLSSRVNSPNCFKALICTTIEKWDLMSAVCVERKPILSKLPNEVEKKYQKFLSDLEFQQSFKSDYEIRHEMDLKKAELLKKGSEDLDLDTVLKETAQDFLDASLEELSKFKAAERITNADNKNDLSSLYRKLDKHLILLVNQKIGDKFYYVLPQGLRQEGETLRQTAERIMKEHCGCELNAQIYSNAPSGFYKYKYPKKIRDERGSLGAKVFIYFARHKNGQVKDQEYKWLDRNEIRKILPKEYNESIEQFLIDEE